MALDFATHTASRPRKKERNTDTTTQGYTAQAHCTLVFLPHVRTVSLTVVFSCMLYMGLSSSLLHAAARTDMCRALTVTAAAVWNQVQLLRKECTSNTISHHVWWRSILVCKPGVLCALEQQDSESDEWRQPREHAACPTKQARARTTILNTSLELEESYVGRANFPLTASTTYLPSSFSPTSCSTTQPHLLLSEFCVQRLCVGVLCLPCRSPAHRIMECSECCGVYFFA